MKLVSAVQAQYTELMAKRDDKLQHDLIKRRAPLDEALVSMDTHVASVSAAANLTVPTECKFVVPDTHVTDTTSIICAEMNLGFSTEILPEIIDLPIYMPSLIKLASVTEPATMTNSSVEFENINKAKLCQDSLLDRHSQPLDCTVILRLNIEVSHGFQAEFLLYENEVLSAVVDRFVATYALSMLYMCLLVYFNMFACS